LPIHNANAPVNPRPFHKRNGRPESPPLVYFITLSVALLWVCSGPVISLAVEVAVRRYDVYQLAIE
jgi:hypothetical protein